jgi:uncharacterized ion transporter superfamily protein YfcC
MASLSGAAAMAQPIFHPVSENVLASDRSVMVRSYMPGSEAIGTWTPS